VGKASREKIALFCHSQRHRELRHRMRGVAGHVAHSDAALGGFVTVDDVGTGGRDRDELQFTDFR